MPKASGMSDNKTSSAQTTGINTQLAHSGHDPRSFHGFVNPPVVHASTVLFDSVASLRRRSTLAYTYGLRGTPTTTALENALNELEGSAGTILLPSGLAACTFPLLAFLGAGDHVLLVDSLYSPTRHFCDTVLKRMGVCVEYFAPDVGAGIADLMRGETKVVFLEAPGSNTFEMMDVAAVAAAAKSRGAVTMIDNTWATPIFFKPLDHGCDVSIHALTKYPGGHSDLMLGSVSATAEAYRRLRDTQMAIGVNAAPDDAYLVLRGLKTMGVRLRRHEESALRIAEWLEGRDEVAAVLHPALSSFPGHDLWRRQFCGSSGLFSFALRGGDAAVVRFLDALKLFGLGYSWGGHESLAIPVDLSDRRVAKGSPEGGLIRLQIGLEDVPDLLADLDRGFTAVAAS